MKNYCLILCFIFGVHGFSQTAMNTREIEHFKTNVQEKTKHIQTIKTDFVQNKHLSFLSNDIQSEGQMFLNESGYLKWAYTKPNQYSIIFRDDHIYINDNGRKSTVDANNDIFKNISKLIAGSMSGKLFDDQQFEINYLKNENEIITQLIPVNQTLKKYIKEVNLFFPKGKAVVSKVKLIEASDDYTTITFVNKILNAKINSDIFKQ